MSSCWHSRWPWAGAPGVLTDREQAIQRLAMATTLAVFITFSALVGILVLYLIKSALGIDLIPGFSFGVWDWFKGELGLRP